MCYFTYLHTPWCPPAGQSPRGTYQSSALCVGKNLTCTWCRSLCWSRTRSYLSCTLEEEEEKEETDQGLSNPLIWSWSKAKGFGEGGSWKDYTVSPTKKKKKKKKACRCPVNHFSPGLKCIWENLFCLTEIFLSSSCSSLERANQQCENTTTEMVKNYVMLTSF